MQKGTDLPQVAKQKKYFLSMARNLRKLGVFGCFWFKRQMRGVPCPARTQWQQGGDMEICFQNLLVNIDHLTDQWSLCTKNYLVLANQIWFFIKPVFSPREIFLAAGHNLLEKSELSHSLASNSWASAILSLFSPNSIPPVKNRHYFLSYVLPRKPRNLNMPW